jgi:DNA-binding MarR family transcriptional regulator
MGQLRLHERLLEAAGVRVGRAGFRVLYAVQERGESVRVTDLAEQLGVDAPTVTRQVQLLEREGLVERRPDSEDHRATHIGLTDEGRETLKRIMGARQAWFDRLLEGWDEADLHRFADMLRRFAAAVERDVEGTRGD